MTHKAEKFDFELIFNPEKMLASSHTFLNSGAASIFPRQFAEWSHSLPTCRSEPILTALGQSKTTSVTGK